MYTELLIIHWLFQAHCDSLAQDLERQCEELKLAVDAAKSRLLIQLAQERESTTKIYR